MTNTIRRGGFLLLIFAPLILAGAGFALMIAGLLLDNIFVIVGLVLMMVSFVGMHIFNRVAES